MGTLMKFKFQGCSFEWVPSRPSKVLGGLLIILYLYFYVLFLKEASPNRTSIRPRTKPACMEQKKTASALSRWAARSPDRKGRAEAHVRCALASFTE